MESSLIPLLVGASVGLAVAGPLGAILLAGGTLAWRRLRGLRRPQVPGRLVMLLLLVELRSGLSALAALQEVARALPAHEELNRVARLATVSGITAAIADAGPDLRPVMAQLARSQRSGGSLASTVRRLLDQDLAAERSRRLAKARSLPVRLMIPVTLLMLPGLVLLLYAPALLGLFNDLVGYWP